ncbi:MAG: hydantoinase/oxoprolinase family protein [Selenomonas sp.]|uniref:hydantoinase/oxoprolinase family protein n=1 Tax=Selenomonas sp. TaxID=2053611 RepID=UPI0025D8BA2D|nr:hydantoinase/oxoprolinase family protein [Selenomonas sp.]MCI6099879.1 hydantoinase/oxoprolinase family protein [Selenomonas sp.]MCI6232602.1 hydantoinase/oxoprolinase family protein [Selenomonas sp.]
MSKYACVDVGGTFTDAAVVDENGSVNVFKSPTTPHDWTEGILGALRVASEHYEEPFDEFLKDISVVNAGMFTHGSTIATNAVVEKKCGKVGILCTEGFRDVFLFREGPNKNPFDMFLDYPEPFVPRYLTLPVKERINSEGGIDTPLDEEAVKAQTRKLKGYNVEAIAVCFLWSTVNPVHEQRAAELIHEVWPDVTVVLSSEVNPSNREYRRWVSAAMDASLRKLISSYANDLNGRLNDAGFVGKVGMLNAAGGVMSTNEIVNRPLYSVDSGPSMAPIAGRKYAEDDLGEQNAVVLDMGGTTFDVSCVINDEISVSKEAIIGDEIPGISRVNVHSIGAGGGSIAWVDNGGMLRVGPRSAGSVPGPACYNRGGTLPTVTDANCVLGYLNPDFFNDGRMKLYPELAREAIKKHVAEPLGITVMEAAYSIWATVNVNMISAIKDITIWQGIDPRSYAMVAGGGACGLHAIALAEGLEMQHLLIPRTAGGLSAAGGLFSDIVSEYSGSHYTTTARFDFEGVSKVLRALRSQAEKFFARNKIAPAQQRIEVYMEAHYPFQVYELPVNVTPFVNDDFTITPAGVQAMEEAFHKEHERTFSIRDNTYIECVTWRVKAIGKHEREAVLPEAELPKNRDLAYEEGLSSSFRKVFFKEYDDLKMTPVFHGDRLYYGITVHGPAIIEEPTTTIVVLPGYCAKVTKHNSYCIEKEVLKKA